MCSSAKTLPITAAGYLETEFPSEVRHGFVSGKAHPGCGMGKPCYRGC